MKLTERIHSFCICCWRISHCYSIVMRFLTFQAHNLCFVTPLSCSHFRDHGIESLWKIPKVKSGTGRNRLFCSNSQAKKVSIELEWYAWFILAFESMILSYTGILHGHSGTRDQIYVKKSIFYFALCHRWRVVCCSSLLQSWRWKSVDAADWKVRNMQIMYSEIWIRYNVPSWQQDSFPVL